MALVALILVAGCTASSPILGAGPARPGDPWLFDDAIRGARAAGYHPISSDPAAGTFELTARFDRSARFLVRCFADGWVSIHVEGPRVERSGDRLVMDRRLRGEYVRLAEEIGGAIPTWP